MKYEYGLVNYFLHELGNNTITDDIKDDLIEKEINRIKNRSIKYNKYLDINNENIKKIIVCIDLLLEIEVSLKKTFLIVASELLIDEKINNIIYNNTDNYDETIKEADKIFIEVIKKYLVKLCI